jgi:hypothetical protein
MKEFWDQRYRAEAYAYGESPNVWFRSRLESLPPGRILLPADGEGRNGVHAANLGWDVVCFDISEEGRKKALRLEEKMGVRIDYQIASVDEFMADAASFDVVALIYAHFPSSVRRDWHRRLEGLLKPGGLVLLEAFSMAHLTYFLHDPKIGGPRDRDMLYESSAIALDFSGCKPVFQEECEVRLEEGDFHIGTGHVVRYVGLRG